MSDDYKYACQRAELLGLSAPTEDEWAKSEAARKKEIEEQEAQDDAKAQDLEQTGENMKRVGGGLDELNSILTATQKKLNRFKTVCGSLGTLLKVRAKSHPGTPEHKARKSKELNSPEEKEAEDKKKEIKTMELSENPEDAENPEDCVKPGTFLQRKIEINQKLGSHIDKLDSLINKAENAQYSMQHQSKQMKKLLK
ncbi:uncharacterized protein LOC117167785 [Belonocnema kinseyi]|uniref:uncharacterized protein LOC117167785 n=1 Tax=Belonocnema kinseyi TaxID=2817044 RepID=UPI00143CC7AE|nr:uncharacterized protein LOC117167785 [Belonocnema kinseyi]